MPFIFMTFNSQNLGFVLVFFLDFCPYQHTKLNMTVGEDDSFVGYSAV
jgi:hypothetical protein